MKIVRFQIADKILYGLVKDSKVYEIEGNINNQINENGIVHNLYDIKILAPCVPSKIIGVGMNYESHVKELNTKVPIEPLIFLKAPSAILNPEEGIVLPIISQRVDYEAELAVIIKKTAKNIPIDKARDYILGFTCFNDVTARDLQNKDGQWARAKSFDTFAPIGPYIVNDICPHNLKVSIYLNGEKRQCFSTQNMVFKVEELVSYISEIMTLYPGDVIATGTGAGIGKLEPGDVVEVEIEKIGILRNYVKIFKET